MQLPAELPFCRSDPSIFRPGTSLSRPKAYSYCVQAIATARQYVLNTADRQIAVFDLTCQPAFRDHVEQRDRSLPPTPGRTPPSCPNPHTHLGSHHQLKGFPTPCPH